MYRRRVEYCANNIFVFTVTIQHKILYRLNDTRLYGNDTLVYTIYAYLFRWDVVKETVRIQIYTVYNRYVN